MCDKNLSGIAFEFGSAVKNINDNKKGFYYFTCYYTPGSDTYTVRLNKECFFNFYKASLYLPCSYKNREVNICLI
jgi:hypothetical protein